MEKSRKEDAEALGKLVNHKATEIVRGIVLEEERRLSGGSMKYATLQQQIIQIIDLLILSLLKADELLPSTHQDLVHVQGQLHALRRAAYHGDSKESTTQIHTAEKEQGTGSIRAEADVQGTPGDRP